MTRVLRCVTTGVRLLVLLLAACSPEPKDSADSAAPAAPELDPAEVRLGGACPLATRFGGFEVAANEGYSAVGGAVADGVVPMDVLTEEATDGDCVLLRRENPRCDPTCDAGEACDFDGTCIPWPTNQDLGTVTVTGLAEAVAMTPTPPGTTYFDTSLPHPAFAPDAVVTVTSSTSAFPPLYGLGVEPLVPTSTELVVGSADLTFGWAAPTGLGRSEVVLRLTVDQHGITPLSLVCTFADDGSGTAPKALVDELLVGGVTGWPNALLTRRTADRADVGAGCADLVVAWEVPIDVSVDGHTPCDSHDDCPPGQLCNFALETCQ